VLRGRRPEFAPIYGERRQLLRHTSSGGVSKHDHRVDRTVYQFNPTTGVMSSSFVRFEGRKRDFPNGRWSRPPMASSMDNREGGPPSSRLIPPVISPRNEYSDGQPLSGLSKQRCSFTILERESRRGSVYRVDASRKLTFITVSTGLTAAAELQGLQASDGFFSEATRRWNARLPGR